MAKYTVNINQNIWDVALMLYGTVEGVYDLLASNPSLNMVDGVKSGDVLEYHEDFVINEDIVSHLKDNNIVPANGERGVYYKQPPGDVIAILDVSPEDESVSFVASGQGTLIVDWGDNSPLEYIKLTETPAEYIHYFDNVAEVRRVRWYGDFQFELLDMTAFVGSFYPLRPITVDKFTKRATGSIPDGLLLFEGTVKMDLQGSELSTLDPVKDMSLQELDLRGVEFKSESVLDDYLEYVADNYGRRRNCIVRLSAEPSQRGYAAIDKILGEVEWNTPEEWKFYINETLYITENGEESENNI